jgi:twinkle protein
MDIRKYLHQKGFQWKEQRRPTGLWATMNCPFCNDREKKFGVNLDMGSFNCLRENNCGVSGSFYELQKRLGDTPVMINTDNVFHKRESKKFVKPKTNTNGLTEEIYRWFKTRCISEKTLTEFKVTQKDNAICFNYFKNGELVNIKYRTLDKKFWQEKNTEPTLYNMDRCNQSHELYICEGEIDCMSFWESGIKNCVSIPQGTKDLNWITYQWDFLNQFEKIYLVFDQDEAGQEMIDEIATRLGKWRVSNIILPAKDANDCLMRFGKESLFQENLLKKDFALKTLNTHDAFIDQLEENYNNPKKLTGVQTRFKNLNKIIKGWRGKELSVWTGRNGSGKSTFLNEIIIDLVNNDEICCVGSLEMEPEVFLEWMAFQLFDTNYLTEKIFNSFRNWKPDQLWIYHDGEMSTTSPEILLEAFEFAARRYGCKHFFIDSLMKIKLNIRNILDEQKRFVDMLCDFKRKFDCHIHLIAHPRKLRTDTDILSTVDISGNGHITDLADNVFIIDRLSEEFKEKEIEKGKDPADTILAIKKNRKYGKRGKVFFKVDANTKVFREF